MAITEAEWMESTKKAREEATRARSMEVGLMRQAAVDARYLTGRDEWDKYLRMLQAELDSATHEVNGVHAQLATPLSSDALRLLYVKLNVLTERIRIVQWCMSLPKQICDSAEQVTA